MKPMTNRPAHTEHDKNIIQIREALLKRELRLAESLLHSSPTQREDVSLSTGWADLDAALGGGLRRASLNEICLGHTSLGVLEALLPRLLPPFLPGEEAPGLWSWVHPDHQLHAPALAAAGLPLERFVAVRPRTADEQLWALETLLDAGSCDLVLSPLDRASDTALRRLQLAARRGGTTLILLRDERRAELPSPAPVRLRAHPTPSDPARRRLELEVFKRPGLKHPETVALEWSPDALDARPLLRLRDRPSHPFARGRRGRPVGPLSNRA